MLYTGQVAGVVVLRLVGGPRAYVGTMVSRDCVRPVPSRAGTKPGLLGKLQDDHPVNTMSG